MRPELEIDTFDDLKLHAFLSYSQEDRAAVKQIAAWLDLDNITSWVDYEDVVPGTPDWEKSIRSALAKSFAFILFASPTSRDSTFVRAEVSLAQAKSIPIIPVWVRGDKWEDCIPLSLMYNQYVDLRGDTLDLNSRSRSDKFITSGSDKLIKALRHIIAQIYPDMIYIKHAITTNTQRIWSSNNGLDIRIEHKPRLARPPRGYVLIILEDSRDIDISNDQLVPGVLIRLSHYDLISSLLNDVYMSFLLNKYPVLSYGEKWVLCSLSPYDEGVFKIIVPWEWIFSGRCSSDVWSEWLRTMSSTQCGIRAGETYFINEPQRDARKYSSFAISKANVSYLSIPSIKEMYMYYKKDANRLARAKIENGLPYIVLTTNIPFAREMVKNGKIYCFD